MPTPYPTEPLSQHQRELVLASWLDVSLEQIEGFAQGLSEDDFAALPDGVNDHVGGYASAMRDADAAADDADRGPAAQLMFQHVALMSDALLLWAVREISGKDPLS